MPWDPTAVRAAHALSMTDAEVASVAAKFPKAPDGEVYVDAVFEGGGVKGVGFLGALRCFADAGIRMRKVAGTSAGAITAAAVASGMPIDDIEGSVGGLDFRTFLSKKSKPWWCIWNGAPDDDLDNLGGMIANLALVGAKGQYSSQPCLEWMRGLLKGRLETFADLQAGGPEWHQKRDLRVIVTDISQGEMRVLPTDLPAYGIEPGAFEVAEAVRLSMSIPFFFEPGTLKDSTIIDGGVLCNCPLWLYDAPLGVTPVCPTIGFLLSDRTETRQINNVVDILAAMIGTMTVAQDKKYVRDHDQKRIVHIDTLGVQATQFSLGDETKSGLYVQGYVAAKRFLLEEWDWDAYVAARGVCSEAGPSGAGLSGAVPSGAGPSGAGLSER